MFRQSQAAPKMKRGPRQIAPKKQALIRQAKMTKVHTVNHKFLRLSPACAELYSSTLPVGKHTDGILLLETHIRPGHKDGAQSCH
jgi:hypothetical protein